MNLEREITVSSTTESMMLAYVKKVYGKIINPKFDIHDFARVHFNKKRVLEQLKYVSYLKGDIDKAQKVLDAGAGGGLSVIGFRKLGYNSFGYEIDKRIWDISQKLLLENGLNPDIIKFVEPDYKRLPYTDGTFDIIFSYFVLEHVRNPIHYLSELSRVLKINGKILLVCPNYIIPYETHYGLFMFPYIFKSLNKNILRACRRDPSIFSELSFPTPLKVRKWIADSGLIGINLSKEYFIKSLFCEKDYSIRSNTAIFIARACERLDLIWLIKLIGLYNPIFFILEHERKMG